MYKGSRASQARVSIVSPSSNSANLVFLLLMMFSVDVDQFELEFNTNFSWWNMGVEIFVFVYLEKDYLCVLVNLAFSPLMKKTLAYIHFKMYV